MNITREQVEKAFDKGSQLLTVEYAINICMALINPPNPPNPPNPLTPNHALVQGGDMRYKEEDVERLIKAAVEYERAFGTQIKSDDFCLLSREFHDAAQPFITDPLEELKANYNDLIMAVGTKYPNETRHQTARRYILQHEGRDEYQESAEKKAGEVFGE